MNMTDTEVNALGFDPEDRLDLIRQMNKTNTEINALGVVGILD